MVTILRCLISFKKISQLLLLAGAVRERERRKLKVLSFSGCLLFFVLNPEINYESSVSPMGTFLGFLQGAILFSKLFDIYMKVLGQIILRFGESYPDSAEDARIFFFPMWF